MKWTKFKIETVTEAEDIIISALYDIGLEGAMVEDKIPLTDEEKAGMFVDIPPEPGEDDGIAMLSFFVEQNDEGKLIVSGEERDIPSLMGSIGAVLTGLREHCNIGSGTIYVEETEDIDWINNWKEFFHQFTINDLLIIPSWEEPSAQSLERCDKTLRIDPGTAFGTGAHETTSLVIRQLQEHIKPGDEILDLGTGSGILSIVALKYGAKKAIGTDLDDNCVEAIEQNLNANSIPPDKMLLILGNVIDDPELRGLLGYGEPRYEIITANILAEVLLDINPFIPGFLKEGGTYITSGILTEKEDKVKASIEAAGLVVTGITRDGEWSCITAKKQ